MNALTVPQAAIKLADPREVLEARAEARAYLWWHGLIDGLPEAVDPLQAYAVQSGLVAALGQDRVQKIIARPFERLRGAELEAPQ